MLHAKFQDNKIYGSGEEDFQRFLTYMGMAAILVLIFTKFMFPPPKRLHIKRKRCLKIMVIHTCI